MADLPIPNLWGLRRPSDFQELQGASGVFLELKTPNLSIPFAAVLSAPELLSVSLHVLNPRDS